MTRQINKKAYINESGDIFLTNTELHKIADAFTFSQDTKSKTWTVSHKLDTRRVHVQIFEQGRIIIPQKITIIDNNTIEVLFSAPQFGKCLITGQV